MRPATTIWRVCSYGCSTPWIRWERSEWFWTRSKRSLPGSPPSVLRAELRRLFRWLKDRNLTTVVTAEQGEGTLTRHGLEEYVSDCVILLDHRIHDQISTRRLRIVKYRGTKHGADEYPFLIDESGLSVLPVTAATLNHKISRERVSTGIPDLDTMMEGKGYYRGSSVLVSGTAGSGKTTLACHFADATCRRGGRCLYIGFEESTDQVFRNAASVGIDLHRYVKKGLLFHEAWRPTQYGMEMHLLRIHKLIDTLKPEAVIIDPVSNLIGTSTQRDVQSMLMRLIDFLKEKGITALLITLTKGGKHLEGTEEQISSLIDTWILVRDVEQSGERNRCLYILKSRGMAHSNQLREFMITSQGIKLLTPYIGSGQVFTGSARLAQEAKDSAEALQRKQTIERKRGELQAKRRELEARIENLRAEYAAEENQMETLIQQAQNVEHRLELDTQEMAGSRQAGASTGKPRQKAGKWSRAMKTKEKKAKGKAANGAAVAAEVLELRLYVAGQTPKSLAALANLKRICDEHLKQECRIEVIDLVKHPQLAQGDQILAIPTLVRRVPAPLRKIIGDLSNVERVLVGLDIRGPSAPAAKAESA